MFFDCLSSYAHRIGVGDVLSRGLPSLCDAARMLPQLAKTILLLQCCFR